MKQIQVVFFLLSAFLIQISAQPIELTVDEIFTNSEFSGPYLEEVRWIANGEKFSHIKDGNIYCYDIESGKEKLILEAAELKRGWKEAPDEIPWYCWSPDEKYIVAASRLTFRYDKPGGSFFIYEIKTGKIKSIIEAEEEQWLPAFSPDSKKLGFVRERNLFLFDLREGTEKQLTRDGSDVILNGEYDWVYQEELDGKYGWKWSPDSKKIAYLQFDCSPVPEIQMAKWDSLYFNFVNIRYPKPGGGISEASVAVVNVETGENQILISYNNDDLYVPEIMFSRKSSQVIWKTLSRLQNEKSLLMYDLESESLSTLVNEQSDAWLRIYDNPYFFNDNSQFTWISERDGSRQIYLAGMDGEIKIQLTKGDFEIHKIIAVNEEEKKVYFTSNESGKIYEDLWSVEYPSCKRERITKETGFNEINMADNSSYYINSRSRVYMLPEITLNDISGKRRAILFGDNSLLEQYNLPTPEFFEIEAETKEKLGCMMIKPADFDPEKKYPVIIYMYSGPGSVLIQDKYSKVRNMWHGLLAQKGYITFMIDSRGTGGRGAAYRHIAYKKMGHYEITDLDKGIDYLSSLGYVDADRIGIWGWSYGGYVASMAACRLPDKIKAAIAVAPVTDWRFYDNVYTERFNSLPELNKEGYDNGSVLKYAENLKAKFLLVHGTADDNVHIQHSIKLIDELIKYNKQFSAFFYPERNHSIVGGNSRRHLFNMLTEFVLENL